MEESPSAGNVLSHLWLSLQTWSGAHSHEAIALAYIELNIITNEIATLLQWWIVIKRLCYRSWYTVWISLSHCHQLPTNCVLTWGFFGQWAKGQKRWLCLMALVSILNRYVNLQTWQVVIEEKGMKRRCGCWTYRLTYRVPSYRNWTLLTASCSISQINMLFFYFLTRQHKPLR